MGTLAAGVAHEVNNPLASISSLIQMIRSNDRLDEETRDKLKLISAQIQRITQVTKDMTDFARARPSAKRPVDINSIVLGSLRLASFDNAFQKLKIHQSLDGQLPKVAADNDQLHQVFLNLFLNARDAMPAGGELFVDSVYDDEEVRISIRDTGAGIDDGAMKQIFDPFFTTKPAGAGTGLGLAVCYGIMTAHNGSIEVNSKRSTGTEFIVRLPRN
jgi:signal transduction histidine kinase